VTAALLFDRGEEDTYTPIYKEGTTMRIEGNADNGQWQWAARNAATSAKPELAVDREPDGDSDDVRKTSLQPAQKAQQMIAPTDEGTGKKVNLLA
jgi:hypothetical protein